MKTFSFRPFTIFLIAFFITLSLITYSQNKFGIKVGFGASKEFNSLISTSFKPDLDLGGFYSFKLNEFTHLRCNLRYIQRGYKDKLTLISSGDTKFDKTKYQLISTGPDLIFQLIDSKASLYIITGVNFNYLFHQSFAFSQNSEGSEPYDLDKFQLGANCGFGLEFYQRYFIELQLEGNILNKANKSKNPELKAYDLYLGMAIGYSFSKSQRK